MRVDVQTQVAGMSASLELPARMDFPAASELHAGFVAARGADLAVSCKSVTALGTNCLQVLLSASRTWAEDGKSLSFVDLSEEFTQQLGHFGLSLDDFSQGDS